MTESGASNQVLYLKCRWSDNESTRSDSFREFRRSNEFYDLTLCADNGTDVVKAHKVILAAGSNLFRRILSGNANQNTLLYLKGVHLKELESLVEFIYYGQVKVEQEALDKFLAAANEFEVKGLENFYRSEATTTISGNRINSGNNLTSASIRNNRSNASISTSSNNDNSYSISNGIVNSTCSRSDNNSSSITPIGKGVTISHNKSKCNPISNSSRNSFRDSPLKQLTEVDPLGLEEIYTTRKRQKVDTPDDFDIDADVDVDDMLKAYVRKVKVDPDLDSSYKEIKIKDEKPTDPSSQACSLSEIKAEEEEGSNPIYVDSGNSSLQEPAKFSKTRRGNPMLVDADGYTYLMSKKESDQLYWGCRVARTVKTDKCKARAVTKGFFITKKFKSHSHEPQF